MSFLMPHSGYNATPWKTALSREFLSRTKLCLGGLFTTRTMNAFSCIDQHLLACVSFPLEVLLLCKS